MSDERLQMMCWRDHERGRLRGKAAELRNEALGRSRAVQNRASLRRRDGPEDKGKYSWISSALAQMQCACTRRQVLDVEDCLRDWRLTGS